MSKKIIREAAEQPATQPPAAPPPPAGPAQTAEPEPPAKSFEERFGASWVVWIGGLAAIASEYKARNAAEGAAMEAFVARLVPPAG